MNLIMRSSLYSLCELRVAKSTPVDNKFERRNFSVFVEQDDFAAFL